MYNILLKEVVSMEMQLRECQEHGEQHQFIDDFEHELVRLLDRVGKALDQLNTTAEAA